MDLFHSVSSPQLKQLQDILKTYVMYNMDLGKRRGREKGERDRDRDRQRQVTERDRESNREIETERDREERVCVY